jgi:hypothetical protein
MSEKNIALMMWIRLFKEKEKEGGEGRSEHDGQWKEEEKHLFTSSHFHPTIFFKPLFFNLKVLLYHASRSLLTHFLPFPEPIN